MNGDQLISRLRAADPAPAPAAPGRDGDALFAAILATPGDPRLLRAEQRGRPRGLRRLRAHRGGLLACAVVVAACGTAGVASVTGVINPDNPFASLARVPPRQLFSANLDRLPRPGAHAFGTIAIVPSSVREVGTLTVPGVGSVQYWIARRANGWRCSAFRFPDGVWAGTTIRERYSFAGAGSGCNRGPWITWEGPDFRYDSIWLGGTHMAHRPAPTLYGVVFGTVRAPGLPARVRDLRSGAVTRVYPGGYFALVLPPRGGAIPYVQLEALSASGRVLVRAPVDHVTFGP